MKRIFFQSILLLAPMALLAQKNEKETPAAGILNNLTPKVFSGNPNISGMNNKILPGHFPAVNGSFLLNNNNLAPEYPFNIPKQPINSKNSMPCYTPDMSAVASMPVISGIVNNSLPEPMPGAFINNKKK